MAFGVLDLSIITALLIKELEDCVTASKLWDENTPPNQTVVKHKPKVSGLPPDLLRSKSDYTYISLYLFHVAPEKFYRNTYPIPNFEARDKDNKVVKSLAVEQEIPHQPLPLTLYYLLSAQSDDYEREQQAMSIALKCLHEHPILTATVPSDRQHRKQEFTLSLEPQNVDEIGRLWQATSTALRLSAVYRASVIFLKPEDLGDPVKPVTEPAHVHVYVKDVIFEITLTPPPADLRAAAVGGFVKHVSKLEFDGAALDATETAPGPGQYRFITPIKLELRPPAGTAAGRHRLRVSFTPTDAPAEAEVIIP
jgi:hypothetical protein